jgi:hypothetical protein
VAKNKKELTFAQKEIAKLKNQLHQSKKNFAKEWAECGFKGKTENSSKDEVGARYSVNKLNRPQH